MCTFVLTTDFVPFFPLHTTLNLGEICMLMQPKEADGDVEKSKLSGAIFH